MLRLRPVTITEAKRFVGRHHRHNKPPVGALFAIGCEDAEGTLRGVAVVGRPIARMLQDGWTCEVNRLCTDGADNACSLLYGAAARAAKALGYRRIITYILASEPGTSLRAAGWERDKDTAAKETWTCTVRLRVQTDLFGETRPAGDKVRWVRRLADQEVRL